MTEEQVRKAAFLSKSCLFIHKNFPVQRTILSPEDIVVRGEGLRILDWLIEYDFIPILVCNLSQVGDGYIEKETGHRIVQSYMRETKSSEIDPPRLKHVFACPDSSLSQIHAGFSQMYCESYLGEEDGEEVFSHRYLDNQDLTIFGAERGIQFSLPHLGMLVWGDVLIPNLILDRSESIGIVGQRDRDGLLSACKSANLKGVIEFDPDTLTLCLIG